MHTLKNPNRNYVGFSSLFLFCCTHSPPPPPPATLVCCFPRLHCREIQIQWMFHILTLMDQLTKMAYFISRTGLPLAKDTAQLYSDHVVCLHGLLDHITSNPHLFPNSGTRPCICWESMPSSCPHTTHKQMLKRREKTRSWSNTSGATSIFTQHNRGPLLTLAEFAYNNSLHASTEQMPFISNYEFHPRLHPALPITFNNSAAMDCV